MSWNPRRFTTARREPLPCIAAIPATAPSWTATATGWLVRSDPINVSNLTCFVSNNRNRGYALMTCPGFRRV